MGDKFVDPKTKKEVFRIEENKEIVSDEYKDKWDKKKIDNPPQKSEDDKKEKIEEKDGADN